MHPTLRDLREHLGSLYQPQGLQIHGTRPEGLSVCPSALEECPFKVGTPEVCAPQVSLPQVSATKIRIAKVCLPKLGFS
jgi:hypothetical protein